MKHTSNHPSAVSGRRRRPTFAPPSARHRGSLLAALGVLLGSAAAQASEDAPRLDERTAYTVDGGHLKLGILSAEYGVFDRLAIGVDPPAWAARAVLPIWVPNVHAEVGVIQSRQFLLSLKVAGYWADVGSDDAPGTLTVVPVSAFASVELARRWWLHGEATYLFADATGTGDLDDAEVEGAVTARAAQLGAMLELRLSRVTSLTLVGRYQVYVGPLVFKGTTEPDDYTSVRLEGSMRPRVEHPWQVIPGVAFVWTNVRLVAGVGYGNYFIPGIGIAAQDRSVVPDLSFAVVL